MTVLNRQAARLGEYGDAAANDNGEAVPAGGAVTSISPTTAVVGGADLTLTVNGSGFGAAAVIVFNGGPEPTTVVSDTALTTTVRPGTASGPAVVPVTVQGAAGSANFTFTASGG